MNKYKFAIEERLVRFVEKEADSLEEAAQQVRDEYRSGEIVLDGDDFTYVQMKCLLPEQTEWTDMD